MLEVWKDDEGHTHGEKDGPTVRTRHRGRLIEVTALPGHVRIRSTFPNGKRAERLIPVPPL